MSELPTGWELAPLENICNLNYGKNLPTKEFIETGFPVFGANGQIGFYSSYHYEEPQLLITCRGATCGAITRSLPRSFVTNNSIVVSPRNQINLDTHFLEYFLKGYDTSSVITGSAQPQITLNNLKNLKVFLPPLNEQHRIVTKLDKLFTRSRRIREELEPISKLIKRYKQAVLSEACSGKMTQELRKAKKLPDLKTVQLAEVVLDFFYGSSAKSQSSGIVPVLRMGNIQNGLLDWTGLVYTSDAVEIAKYQLQEGDVLFNRTNSPELVGKTALYKGEYKAIYAGYLIRIRCSQNLLPAFLTYVLNSPTGRYYCWQVKTDGVSQSNINAKKLGAFTFDLPSIEEQQEIVKRIDKLFKAIDKVDQEYQKAIKLCTRLEQAALTKAFRGELVPQDPKDVDFRQPDRVPAAVLLERILSE